MGNNDYKGSDLGDDSKIIDDKSFAFGTGRDVEMEYDSAGDFLKITKGGVSKTSLNKTIRLIIAQHYVFICLWKTAFAR